MLGYLTRAQRIDRGFALLDRLAPRWDDRIQIVRLNISSACDCVVGQVYGSFGTGMIQVSNARIEFRPTVKTAKLFGFYPRKFESAAKLTAAWQKRIAQRKSMRHLARRAMAEANAKLEV